MSAPARALGALSALGAATIAVGCAGINDRIGSGPLVLSPEVEQAYAVFLAQYSDDFEPGYFAVSRDGRVFGFSYCPDLRCRRGAQQLALQSCNHGRSTGDCLLYARGEKILWRFTD